MLNTAAHQYLQITRPVTVETAHRHPRHTVERVGELLAGGVEARADVQRRNLFEITDGRDVFYIHISPVSGNVLLLATWALEQTPEPAFATV
jgi:hypothetical protein